MFNLDVAELDNYYVGEHGWLVHNTNPFRCLTAAERLVYNDLISQGRKVDVVFNDPTRKTVDFLVDGVPTELKTLTNPNVNTVITRIQNGFKQGAQSVIIDARAANLTMDQAQQALTRARGSFGGTLPGNVEIWTNNGILGR